MNLFIVDDHSMLKNGLTNYLETNTKWKVIGTFFTGNECMEELQRRMLYKAELPDLVIVDIQLANEESGFELVKQLKKKYPQIKIVMYSMYNTWGFILQAKDLGVQGYISKVADDEELVECLNSVYEGRTYYEKKSESIQEEITSIVSVLKKQEKLVFELALQGKSNKQIADQLFISLHTVENYISYLVKISSSHTREEMIEKYK